MRASNPSFSSVFLVRYLFFVNAAVLLVFGIGTLLRITQNPDSRIMYLVYAVLMFADAAVMLACGLYITGRRKLIYRLAAAVLCLNIILTITDQFWVIDFLFLLLNAVALGFLVAGRKEIPA